MKKTSKIFRIIISSVLLLYVSVILLLHLPFVQKEIGKGVAIALSGQLGTEVGVGGVNLGLLNRIVVDDIEILDREGKLLLQVPRVAASINIPSLFVGKIDIQTVQIFGLNAHLRKRTPHAPGNYQFVIDALSSDGGQQDSPLDLNINSLIVRKANVRYDVESAAETKGMFNAGHLHVQNLGITATLRRLSGDSINLSLKRLNFKEANSGLQIDNLRLNIEADKTTATITGLTLATPRSSIELEDAKAAYEGFDALQDGRFSARISNAAITPSDFRALLPALATFTEPCDLSAGIRVDKGQVQVDELRLKNEKSLLLLASSTIYRPQKQTTPWAFRSSIQQLNVGAEDLEAIAGLLVKNDNAISRLSCLDYIQLTGEVGKERDGFFMDADIYSNVGSVYVSGKYGNSDIVRARIETSHLDLAAITGNTDLGETTFCLDVEGKLNEHGVPEGSVFGDIETFDYKGYQYQHLHIDGEGSSNGFKGVASIDDENIQLQFDGVVANFNEASQTADMSLSVRNFNPHALHLTDKHQGERCSFRATANLCGKDIEIATGEIHFDSIQIVTPQTSVALNALNIVSETTAGHDKHIGISSDFLNATFDGNINYSDIVQSFKTQLAQHLPTLVASGQKEQRANGQFAFNIDLSDSELIRHFIDTDYQLVRPIHLKGNFNARKSESSITLDAPHICYNGTDYKNVRAGYIGTKDGANLAVSLLRIIDETALRVGIDASAQDDQLTTELKWKKIQDNPTNGNIKSVTSFETEKGKLHTHIQLLPSMLSFNDTIWHLTSSHVDIRGKNIYCQGLKVYNGNRFLKVDGVVSEDASDSIIAELNELQVKYVQDLIGFQAVRFDGKASGRASIGNIYKKPHFNADLTIDNFHLNDGLLGKGAFHAYWDDAIDGVQLSGHIKDLADGKERTTNVAGYIAPSSKDILLKINTIHTNAEFLNGFIGSTFKDISGEVNGEIDIMGPLNDINLVGNVTADIGMRLKATNVKYFVSPQDTIRLRPYCFSFENIHIYDQQHRAGTVNGTVTHKNMKNFAYDFHVDMQRLLVYDEEVFNADKFRGTVYANGWLNVKGSDGHPLNIDGDVTPTRGSMFAYDAATPDAIATTSFVKFRDKNTNAVALHPVPDSGERQNNLPEDSIADDETILATYARNAAVADNEFQYDGDILMNVGIHLTPECEIKLRMDNVEDGYISTFGHGTLQAFYHNKQPFTLNGTYNIMNGRYRLYLQDIIFRDLAIQEGSNVVFNGNPFDADIHLICWHVLSSVPLSDLTSSSAYVQNNKVKVVCILDITGHLGNMNFKFDLNLPNVSDETRQLVRSLISTEEEMNMQIIYLLGLGRFYANEYSRASGEGSSSQAMNTLLSSTISGQINQMLTSIIGSDSKWNFGTGLTTGEKGWNDIDVEGILSGRLLDERLLINGNFGYRDNALTQNASFIGDFDIKWRLKENGNTYLKAYNQTNDRYFTKATLNTQGIGISFQKDFESWRDLFRRTRRKEATNENAAKHEHP